MISGLLVQINSNKQANQNKAKNQVQAPLCLRPEFVGSRKPKIDDVGVSQHLVSQYLASQSVSISVSGISVSTSVSGISVSQYLLSQSLAFQSLSVSGTVFRALLFKHQLYLALTFDLQVLTKTQWVFKS